MEVFGQKLVEKDFSLLLPSIVLVLNPDLQTLRLLSWDYTIVSFKVNKLEPRLKEIFVGRH